MMEEKTKRILIVGITIVILIGFYILTKNVSQDYIKQLGLTLPLPLFTFLIAIVDGFNPCNLFVLTLLVSLMLAESHSRKKIFAVGYTFIIVVYIFYFLFMAAWLNIFKYIGFIDPLRIGIGTIALVAGAINCKPFFFQKEANCPGGICEIKKETFFKRLIHGKIRNVIQVLKTDSIISLIVASIVLAVFASLVELPCTAGFPIIYTGILTGNFLKSSLFYYLYLGLYNIIYVLPLVSIITIIGYTFKGKQISKKTMTLIKFVGGAIMFLLGIILLVNPSLIIGV